MTDLGRRARRWLSDEGHKALLLSTLAYVLAVASFLHFYWSPGRSPTQLELALLFGSAGVVFYLSLRSSTF